MDDVTVRRIFKALEKIETNQNEHKELLTSLDKTVSKQEINIADHIRRTEILELEVLPIKAHVEQIRGVGKFIVFVSVITGIITAILTLN